MMSTRPPGRSGSLGCRAQLCPRCGSAMVERRNREAGEPFLGCSQYPGCRGTRQVVGARSATPSDVRRIRRPRLSHGGRRTGWSDDAELLVARMVGRDLKPWEGCLIQLAGILFVGLFFYWLYASGTILVLIKPNVDWITSQMHLGPVPSR